MNASLSGSPAAPLWRPAALPLSVSLSPAHLGLLGLLIPGLTDAPVTRRLTLSSVPGPGGPFVFPSSRLPLTRLNLRLLDLGPGGYVTLGGRTLSEPAFLSEYRRGSLRFTAALHAALATQPHWASLYAALDRATRSLRGPPDQDTEDAAFIQLDAPAPLAHRDANLLSGAHQLPSSRYVLCAHWDGQALTRHEVYTPEGQRVPLRPDALTPSMSPPGTLPHPGAPGERVPLELQHAGSDHFQHAMSLHLLTRRALLRGYAATLQPAAPAPATRPTITRTAITFTATGATAP